MTTHKESFKVGRVRQYGITGRDGWRDGSVVTPHGIVAVYSQGGAGVRAHSRFDFVWRGKQHMWTVGREMSALGLTIAAGRMAREIAGNKP